jgi:hypothetical protein
VLRDQGYRTAQGAVTSVWGNGATMIGEGELIDIEEIPSHIFRTLSDVDILRIPY